MRLFVAINPPDGVRERIAAGTEELRSLDGFRWVAPETIHLTLKFLGETGEETAGRIVRALTRVAASPAPFTARITAPGAFPNLRRPRVIWLGLDGGRELAGLRDALEDALADLGIERDGRPFHPHLTLGRARRGRPLDQGRLDSLLARTEVSGWWRVGEVDLMRSHLRSNGAVYEVFASARLQGRRPRGGASDGEAARGHGG